MKHVVEIVARMGDSIVGTWHLREGDVFRVGTAHDVDLPSTIATTWPLVTWARDGFALRLPVGITDLTFGRVHLTIATVDAPTDALPKPALEARPFAYLAASLVAQVGAALAIVALVAPRPDPVTPDRPERRAVAFRSPVEEPAPDETPHETRERLARDAATARALLAREPAPALFEIPPLPPNATTEQRRAHAIATATATATTMASMTGLMGVMGTVNFADATAGLEGVQGYDVYEAQGFGGQRRFDPKLAPSKLDPYATVATGRGAGQDYFPSRSEPTIAVEIAATGAIRDELRDHRWSLAHCYKAAKARGAGDVVVELAIAADGKVTSATGQGFGTVGACAARVASEIAFPATTEPARVRVPMRFSPAAT